MNEKYSEALKHLRKAKEYAPEDPKVYNNLAMTYYFKDKTAKAIELLKTSIELEEKNSDARVNLGGIYLRQNDLRKALKQYKKVLEDLTYTKQFRAYYNMALIHDKLGHTSKAISYLKKSLAENENYCPSIYRLGRFSYDQQDYEKAYKLFARSSRAPCSKSVEPLYYRADSQYRRHNMDQALKEFETVIQMYPDSSYAKKAQRRIRSIKSKIALSSRLKKQKNQSGAKKEYQSRSSQETKERIKKLRKKAEEVVSPSF